MEKEISTGQKAKVYLKLHLNIYIFPNFRYFRAIIVYVHRLDIYQLFINFTFR